MQIKITRPIYIRKGPGRSHDFLAPIFPSGKGIEVDGVEKGENWKGIDDWYFKFNDKGEKQWYWAGGTLARTYSDRKFDFLADPFNLSFIDATDPGDENKWKVGWAHVDQQIWKIWKENNTRGRGVRVAVIDTGANFINNDLKGQINVGLSKNYDVFSVSIDDTDAAEHGTKSAGVIAANSSNANTVFGVAPQCEVVVLRLFTNSDLNGYDIGNFCQALKDARAAKVDIISMSFNVGKSSPELEKEIQLCRKANILLVASVGDEGQSVGIVNSYPAFFKECFSVGAYLLDNNERTIYRQFSAKSDHLLCLAPGKDILTTSSGSGRAFHHFTSAAAPLVAGIFALIVSYKKSRGLMVDPKDFFEKLPLACTKTTAPGTWDEKEGGAGFLEGYKLFKLLTT